MKDETNAPHQTTPPPARKTGWSKAARRRAGHTSGSHPLGTRTGGGPGYTIYSDDTFGGGAVQIWDES